MLRYLGRAGDGYISYGQFRNFLLLLPPEQVLFAAAALLSCSEGSLRARRASAQL